MSVDKRFKDLLDYLGQPIIHDHSGDKTICYLTFDFNDIQHVKHRLMQDWFDLAKYKGKNIVKLSLHQVLNEFLKKDDYRIEAGQDAVEDLDDMKEVFDSLGENLKNQEVIEKAILNKQKEVKKINNGVLMITDLEVIHPFTRFGPIEQKIYSEIDVPLVVLYPGEKSGSALKFLGFYPEDGNYRSKHF